MENVVIGINGLGRMGKLVLWQLIAAEVPIVIVNVGREVGDCFEDFGSYVTFDSTYGSLKKALFGAFGGTNLVATILDEEGVFQFHRTRVVLLRESRDPWSIPWGEYEVQVVVETTGKYNYPERPIHYNQNGVVGSVKGHFESSSVKKVLVSSPLKGVITDDAVMRVMGVNDEDYLPVKHRIISNASCSTNCLAGMVASFLNEIGADNVKVMSVPIVHAKTGKQPGLDRLPATGKSDLCTYRNCNGAAFISSTGAADALKKVVSGLERVQFDAKSIRVDMDTVSLVCAHIVFRAGAFYSSDDLKRIFTKDQPNYLGFSEEEIFSGNIIGDSRAVVVDGKKSNILTVDSDLDIYMASLYGWFDNEWGYVCRLMENLRDIIKNL